VDTYAKVTAYYVNVSLDEETIYLSKINFTISFTYVRKYFKNMLNNMMTCN